LPKVTAHEAPHDTRTPRHHLAATTRIALLAVVALVVIWGGDLLIPLVASRAGAALGRPVTIAHLHIVPGRILQVTADDVTVGNPPDWTGEPLARLTHLTVQADAWAVFSPHLDDPLPHLHEQNLVECVR
jgi:AsmA family protein